VLVASSRETWNEFVKCLELFSNDAITKEDMVDLVQVRYLCYVCVICVMCDVLCVMCDVLCIMY
jgi:hypothetical protein